MANGQPFVRDRRMAKRLSNLLRSYGYVVYSTCPGDNRAFYTFQMDDEHKLDKNSLVELGIMPHQLYWHIVGSAPNEFFAAKELLAHFGIDFVAEPTQAGGLSSVQINPQHAEALAKQGVDVGRLGQGPGVPVVSALDQGVEPVFDETPSTPGLGEELDKRTAAVEAAQPMVATPPLVEPPDPFEEPAKSEPPPPTPPTETMEDLEMRHVGTIKREDLAKERGKQSKEDEFFNQHGG